MMDTAVSANNVANALTPGFSASRAVAMEQAGGRGVDTYTVQTGQGVDMVGEMVEQSMASGYAKANGAVIKTSSEMLGTLINMFA